MEARQQISKSRVLKVESGESWESFIAQAKNQGSPVFAHFSASWCVPSLAMNSYVEELATNYQDVLFLLVDVDEVKHELRDPRTSGAATKLHKLRDPRTVGAMAKFRWADAVHPNFRREVASKMEVKAMPTFIIIKDGTPVDKMVGANPEEIKKRIEALVHRSI